MAARLRDTGHLIAAAAVFGVFVNLLMLTGPLFMLHLYNYVLTTGSVATLVALSGLVAFLFAIMAILDVLRGRIMGRVAGRFAQGLAPLVFDAAIAANQPHASDAGLPQLETLRRMLASPVLLAVFDLPWTFLFLLVLVGFHPALGALAAAGVLAMAAIALGGHWLLRGRLANARRASTEVTQLGTDLMAAGQSLRALGQHSAHRAHWAASLDQAAALGSGTADRAAVLNGLSVYLRHTLHAAMLGLGAYLVLLGQVSPGAMIAGAILTARLIVPVEHVAGQWHMLQAAVTAWRQLDQLLSAAHPRAGAHLALPAPLRSLEVAQVTVFPPGSTQASLRMLGFRIEAGQALGVAGPSGAGKTTLAKVLTGAIAPSAGTILLDGTPRRHFVPAVLERAIGYLPQHPVYPSGTVAQTIGGPAENTATAAVITAARLADAHGLILALPAGYATPVATARARLSQGQMQRIALARALFDSPALVVLDAPDTHLDQAGFDTLAQAVSALKSRGTMVISLSQQATMLGYCDRIIHLEEGVRQAVGRSAQIRQNSARPAAVGESA